LPLKNFHQGVITARLPARLHYFKVNASVFFKYYDIFSFFEAAAFKLLVGYIMNLPSVFTGFHLG